MKTGRPIRHGLYQARPRTCPCGVVFTARSPQATYCGTECRVKFGQYGRTTYGQKPERALGWTR